MIQVSFSSPVPWLIGWLPDQFTELGQTDVVVRRVTPATRPRKFVLLAADGGPRLAEVHKIFTVRAQVWATYANGQTDWDTVEQMGSQLEFLIGKAAKVSPLIASVRDIRGPMPVEDPSGVEYRYLTAELQLRGV